MTNAPRLPRRTTSIRTVRTLPVTSFREGVPIEVVARLLTHRSSTTTSQTYIHLEPADIRAALHRAGVWQDETEQ